jgi:hypothetical protein
MVIRMFVIVVEHSSVHLYQQRISNYAGIDLTERLGCRIAILRSLDVSLDALIDASLVVCRPHVSCTAADRLMNPCWPTHSLRGEL